MASARKKECPICSADVTSFMYSPETCADRHRPDQRACSECWEAYLSTAVEDKDPSEIDCMFIHGGPSILSQDDLGRLARAGTPERYYEKLRGSTHFRGQARRWESKRDTQEPASPSVLQPHNRRKDGRVFECKFCLFKTCIDCDRPEHDNETCEQYRDRVVNAPHHLQAQATTAQSYNRCPRCDSFWEWDEEGKRCGHTRCEACKYRFCGNCLIPWVGEGSAYLLGKTSHGQTANGKWCRYRTRDAESGYSLKKRFKPDDETQARLDAKAVLKRERKEAKLKAMTLQDHDREGGAAELNQPVKKRGKTAKHKAESMGDNGDVAVNVAKLSEPVVKERKLLTAA